MTMGVHTCTPGFFFDLFSVDMYVLRLIVVFDNHSEKGNTRLETPRR
jgi:hypothetical protein